MVKNWLKGREEAGIVCVEVESNRYIAFQVVCVKGGGIRFLIMNAIKVGFDNRLITMEGMKVISCRKYLSNTVGVLLLKGTNIYNRYLL